MSIQKNKEHKSIGILKRWDLRLGIILAIIAIIMQVSGIFSSTLDRFYRYRPINTQQLEELEASLSPTIDTSLVSKYAVIDSFYFESNKELINRLASIKNKSNQDSNYQSITMIPAPAGYGKSWMGYKIIREHLSGENIQFISLRDHFINLDSATLLRQHRIKKITLPDLRVKDMNSSNFISINTLPAISNITKGIKNLVDTNSNFIVIDDLDEVHKVTANNLLANIESINSENRKYQILILGRPEAFYPSVNATHPLKFKNDFNLLPVLPPPRYQSFGDIEVRLENWLDYLSTSKGKVFSQEQKKQIKTLLFQNLVEFPYLLFCFETASNSGNLIDLIIAETGNSSIHDQIDSPIKKDIRNNLISGILKRNQDTHYRPTESTLRYTEYTLMVAEIAKHYYKQNKIDNSGWFLVNHNDELEIDYLKKSLKFNVRDVLDRSGLINIKPADNLYLKYRFEPFWLHRYFLELYNDNIDILKTVS